MECKEILTKLRQIQKQGITQEEGERMLQALLDIGARIANIDKQDLTKAEKQILSDLQSIVE